MVKDMVIEVPVRCINCNYPEQFGAKVTAEIICKGKEEQVSKEWRCPVCGAKKTITVFLDKYAEKKSSRILLQSAPKRSEELTPGQVARMTDD